MTEPDKITESELITQILLAHSHGPTRLFRYNVGVAWQGRVLEHTAVRLVLAYPRAVRLGVEGQSDLIGWHAGRFLSIETKVAPRRPTAAQRRFLDLVCAAVGLGGVAYSVEDAARIIRGSV